MYKHIAKALTAVYIFLILVLPQVSAQSPTTDGRINELMETIRKKYNLPALAGAIVTSQGLIAIGAVGVRKAGTNVQVSIDDLWHLGSDTKAMTAMVIGALVEQGKLKWDTTIEQVFPDLAGTLQPELRKVTILQLLSHHAGLPANINWQMASLAGSIQDQRQAALKTVASMKLLSEPGTKFSYSNLGYVIAGAIAEKVTNEKWEELITKLLFKPLGMQSAGFGGTGTPGKIDQPWGHEADGKPVLGNGPTVDNPPVMGPAGTVHSSLADWAQFIADQLRGERAERALLKPDTYKKLHTPPFGGDYSLGWIVTHRSWGGGTVFTHAGSNTMNFAVVWIAPQRDFAVLISANQGGTVAAKACDETAGSLIDFHLKK